MAENARALYRLPIRAAQTAETARAGQA
jgi:hypothetical protein